MKQLYNEARQRVRQAKGCVRKADGSAPAVHGKFEGVAGFGVSVGF